MASDPAPDTWVAWRVADGKGESVRGAQVVVDGRSWACDAEGEGRYVYGQEGGRTGRDASVTARGYLPWTGFFAAGVVSEVRLTSIGSLLVRVHDDDLRPVASVEVWLSKRPVADPDRGDAGSLIRGVTDQDGTVRLEGGQGEYHLQARHPVLVRSSRRAEQRSGAGPEGMVVLAGDERESVVNMSMPYVCGIAVQGGEMFYESFYESDSGYHFPPNLDGALACRQREATLRQRHPGARFVIKVRDHADKRRGLPYGAAMVTCWVLGYEAVRQPLEFVPWNEFLGPTVVWVANMVPSNRFGGLTVMVADSEGAGMPDWTVRVGTPMREWRHDVAEVHHKIIPCGDLVTLPAGNYEISCEGYFESQIPGLKRESVTVTPGSLTTVTLSSTKKWCRCRILLTIPDQGIGASGGVMGLRHVDSGTSVVVFVDDFATPTELWVPEGILEVQARTVALTNTSPYHHLSGATFDARGGTIMNPQIVQRSMVLRQP
jgi:hypothetical protein